MRQNKLMSKLSLRIAASLIVGIGLMTLLSIPIFIFFQKSLFVQHERSRMLEFSDELMENLSDGKSETIEDYIEAKDIHGYQIRVRNQKGDLVYASLSKKMEEKNKISQAHTQQNLEDRMGVRFLPERYREDNLPTTNSYKENGEPDEIVLRKIYRVNGDPLYYYCRESLKSIDSMFSYTNGIMVGMILLASVLSMAIVYFRARSITKPIEVLSELTERVADKDYSVRYSGEISNDEIGLLAENVNHMIDSIQENVNTLNNYNFLLSDRIETLGERDNLRKKMIAQLTHELKTPLAIISSQIEMIYILKDEEKKKNYYNYAIEEIGKMSTAITGVLQNSVYEKNILQGKPEKVNLSEIIGILVDKSRDYVRSHDLKYEWEIDPSCIKYMYPDHVDNIFNNYLTNAIAHSQEKGRVRVTLKDMDPLVRFSVYNDGDPIPPEDQEKIWLEFASLNNQKEITLSGKGETETGSGLGLFIVKEISLVYSSNCGIINKKEGVEFWFDFIDYKENS